MASTSAETPQIVEREAVVTEGTPLKVEPQGGKLAAPWRLDKDGDGRIWVAADGGLAAFANGGLKTVFPRPAGDFVEGFGVASDGTIVLRLRTARVLQRIDASGQKVGTPYPLPSGMKGGEFGDGPGGETWLPSFNKAVAIAIPPAGAPRKLACRSCFGLARCSDGLMWGVETGMFAIDTAGDERRRLYFDIAEHESRPIANGGDIWFFDTAADGRARLNQFDRARLLTRHTLPRGTELLGIAAGADAHFWIWGLRDGQALAARVDRHGAVVAHRLTGGVQTPRELIEGDGGLLWLLDLYEPALFAALT